MHRTILLLAGLCALLFLAGCSSYTPVAGSDNVAYLYGKGGVTMHLEARVYQPQDGEATIYYKLRTSDLLYKGSGGGGPYYARVVMRYESYPMPGSKQLLDSSSTFVKDQALTPDEDKVLIGSLPMKIGHQAPFVVRITAHDLNRDAWSTVLVQVEGGAAGTAQSFLPLGDNNLPLFNDHVRPGTELKIEAESLAGTLLHVARYPAVNQLPAPVFVNAQPPSLDAAPDSTFTMPVGPDGTFRFKAGQEGFYHFRTDTTTMTGYTLFVPAEGYPEVNTAESMLPPLRYITSAKEWEGMATAADSRKQMERFWVDAAGSRDRAREAIAAYYGRVESANRYFTSYTEGWKTDRGLVHIIFGTPTTIRKDDKGETWIYGDESNLMSLAFNFRRRTEPFSTNDLVLQRDAALKSAWYRNVESWRNGRIMQY